MKDRRVLILDNPPYNDLGPLKEAFLEASNRQLAVDVVWKPSALFEILTTETSVELIVMDDVLEGDREAGFGILSQLTRDFPEIPVIVVVDESNVAHGPELIKAGARDFLVRGSGLEHLLETQLKKIARLIDLIDDHRQLKLDWRQLREADRARYQMFGDSMLRERPLSTVPNRCILKFVISATSFSVWLGYLGLYSSLVGEAQAKNWWPAPSTIHPAYPVVPSSWSIALHFQTTFWKANCSVTKRERSPVPNADTWANSNKPMAGPFSWMKSGI